MQCTRLVFLKDSNLLKWATLHLTYLMTFVMPFLFVLMIDRVKLNRSIFSRPTPSMFSKITIFCTYSNHLSSANSAMLLRFIKNLLRYAIKPPLLPRTRRRRWMELCLLMWLATIEKYNYKLDVKTCWIYFPLLSKAICISSYQQLWAALCTVWHGM